MIAHILRGMHVEEHIKLWHDTQNHRLVIALEDKEFCFGNIIYVAEKATELELVQAVNSGLQVLRSVSMRVSEL